MGLGFRVDLGYGEGALTGEKAEEEEETGAGDEGCCKEVYECGFRGGSEVI